MKPKTLSAKALLALLAVPALLVGGCARPQRTQEQVAGPIAPPNLRRAAVPPGGISMSATGAGAGGSEAGGIQNIGGRIGGIAEAPVVTAPHGDEIDVDHGHRMSPTTGNAANGANSDGSGVGDAGTPIPPDVSLAAPAEPKAPISLAPASNEPPAPGPAGKPQPTSAYGAALPPADVLPGR